MGILDKILKRRVIYSSEMCSDCQEAEKFFKEHNIDIVIKRIEEEKYKEELKRKYGRVAVPTILIDGEKFLGFEANKQKIAKKLRIAN